MLKAFVAACAVVCSTAALSVPSSAQEIIHALTGTVSSIDNAGKTITIFQDSGSGGVVYQQMNNPKTRIAFDKHIQPETVSATQFDKQGAYVIVFYFGGDSNRTVVALESLGTGPFQSTNGTVSHYDGHGHTVTIEDESGKPQTFKIVDKTVAETGMGAVDGASFHADKGDHVRIVSSTVDGTPTALFVREM
jgi:hypothetical protein